MKYLLIIATCLGLTSCTVAINLTHTEGTASDIVDETQTNDPKVDPTLSFPMMTYSKHDDTNRSTSYKGRQTSKSLYRPDTRGSIAEANYRQYPKRKHRNDNTYSTREC